MARYYGLRLGLLAAAMTLCATVTAATASPSLGAGTAATTAGYDYDQVIVVMAVDQAPAFVMPALAAQVNAARVFPAYRPRHASPRASGAAVRPSSVAGWRSGRTVRLAG